MTLTRLLPLLVFHPLTAVATEHPAVDVEIFAAMDHTEPRSHGGEDRPFPVFSVSPCLRVIPSSCSV